MCGWGGQIDNDAGVSVRVAAGQQQVRVCACSEIGTIINDSSGVVYAEVRRANRSSHSNVNYAYVH